MTLLFLSFHFCDSHIAELEGWKFLTSCPMTDTKAHISWSSDNNIFPVSWSKSPSLLKAFRKFLLCSLASKSMILLQYCLQTFQTVSQLLYQMLIPRVSFWNSNISFFFSFPFHHCRPWWVDASSWSECIRSLLGKC